MSAPAKKFTLTVRPLPIKYPQMSDLSTILHDKAPGRIVPESERILVARINDRIDGTKYSTVGELYSHLRELGLTAIMTPNPMSSSS
jgi:hypothetical protein